MVVCKDVRQIEITNHPQWVALEITSKETWKIIWERIFQQKNALQLVRKVTLPMLVYRVVMIVGLTRNLEVMEWLRMLNVICLVFMITLSSVEVVSET